MRKTFRARDGECVRDWLRHRVSRLHISSLHSFDKLGPIVTVEISSQYFRNVYSERRDSLQHCCEIMADAFRHFVELFARLRFAETVIFMVSVIQNQRL